MYKVLAGKKKQSMLGHLTVSQCPNEQLTARAELTSHPQYLIGFNRDVPTAAHAIVVTAGVIPTGKFP